MLSKCKKDFEMVCGPIVCIDDLESLMHIDHRSRIKFLILSIITYKYVLYNLKTH